MEDIFIREIEMPYTVKGCVVMDENGDYNIYINNLISKEEAYRTLLHETEHIFKNHFSCYTAAEAERSICGNAKKIEIR